MIPLSECKDRVLYRIGSRNLSFGVFNKNFEGFVGIREKYDAVYLALEFHYETGSPYGTVMPMEELEVVPEGLCVDDDFDNSGLLNWLLEKEQYYRIEKRSAHSPG
jgi:hypothetical protein